MGYGFDKSMERKEVIFFDAKNGRFTRIGNDEEGSMICNYVEGDLIGIRYRKGEYDGFPTHKLDIRLADPDADQDLIVTTTLFVDEQSTTFVAAIVRALANPENGIVNGSSIRIGARSPQQSRKKVTFGSVFHMGDTVPLPEINVDRKDFVRMSQVVKHLCTLIGWPGRGPAHPDLQTESTDPDKTTEQSYQNNSAEAVISQLTESENQPTKEPPLEERREETRMPSEAARLFGAKSANDPDNSFSSSSGGYLSTDNDRDLPFWQSFS